MQKATVMLISNAASCHLLVSTDKYKEPLKEELRIEQCTFRCESFVVKNNFIILHLPSTMYSVLWN